MKLNKSVYLTIALFGFGASFLSHAAIYTFQAGDQTETFINHLKNANDGDEFIINGEVKVLRQNGILTIPKSITFKSPEGSDNSKLHIEGANLDIKGKTVKFENLDLSLKPSRNLNEIFISNFGSGTNISAKPTLIATNGNNLILNNVDTKVEGENENTRPIILLSGGKNGEKETLTIENNKNKTENKIFGIVLDNRYSFNTNGELIKNINSINDTSNVELNIGKNVKVIESLKLSGFDDTNTFNGKVDVNLKSGSVKQIDNSLTKNTNLTLTEINSVGASGILNLKNNSSFATITLDRSNLSLDKNITISHLILKDGSVLELTKPLSIDDEDIAVVANIKNLEVLGDGKSALVSTKNTDLNKIVVEKITKDNGEITFEVYNLEKNLTINNLGNSTLTKTGQDGLGNPIYEITTNTHEDSENIEQPNLTEDTTTTDTPNHSNASDTNGNTEDSGSTNPNEEHPQPPKPPVNNNENSPGDNNIEDKETETNDNVVNEENNNTNENEMGSDPNKKEETEDNATDNGVIEKDKDSNMTDETIDNSNTSEKENEKDSNSIEELNKTLKLIEREFEKNQKPSLEGKIDFEILNKTQQQVLNLKSVPFFKNKNKTGVYVNIETEQGEMLKDYDTTNHSIEIGNNIEILDDLRAGLYVNSNVQKIKNKHNDEVKVNSWKMGIHTQKDVNENITLHGHISGGENNVKTTTLRENEQEVYNVESKYKQKQFQADIGASFPFVINKINVEPMINFQYAFINSPESQERSDYNGILYLKEDKKLKQFSTQLALKFSKNVNDFISIHGMTGVSLPLNNTKEITFYSPIFEKDGNNQQYVYYVKNDKNLIYTINVGLDYLANKNLSINTNFGFMKSKNLTNYGANLGLKYKF